MIIPIYGLNINGIPIKAPQALANLTEEIDQILLAIPSLKYNERKNILNSLSNYPFKVLQIPSIKNITGKEPIQNLNPITAKDILSREVELTLTTPKSINFVDYSILITGAGGSIGSEICRQILELKPKKLILLERSEPSLYQITNEIYEKNINNIEVIPILGDAKDSNFINSVFSKYKIDSIFHAAAYKHVPLVESNPLQGLSNNILSTKIICQNALKYSVKKVTLISSDKAVRPANIMGASKRLAEIIFQCFSQTALKNNIDTIFSIVRFGNVINSSGSAIPLFVDQIAKRKPLTITHP